MEASDIELIRGCIDGNKELFCELVTRYKKLIYSVVYNIINNKEDINDISQEVFLKIYKSLDKYNSEYKFSTWAVRIATNYCLDVLRKKKVDSLPIDEVIGVSSNTDTPEESYIKKEQRNRVNFELERLPDKYRIPLILYHKNGMSYDEMSKALNEPLTIIKNRLYRARMLLREKLSSDRREGIL